MKRYLDTKSEVSFYHIIIKVPDNTYGNKEYAFDENHKSRLKDLFFWLEDIYELKCLCYTIMSTHAHFIICHEKNALANLSLREVAIREQKYRGRKYALDARSCEIRKFKNRLNNLSDFIGNVQKRFTRWYNRQGDNARRGQLFNHNFRSIQLKDTKVLIQCMQYVEMNAVRAQMVSSPQHYQFTSWSDLLKKVSLGKRIKKNIIHCIRLFNGGMETKSDAQVFALYSKRLKLVCEAIREFGSFAKLNRSVLDALLQRHASWSRVKQVESG
ncbi:hypothetical protein LNTAR_00095 [Lentisphaera araneosa HTCC2155]|uniref:Transposase IS200-like domain-containing protein n=1 Tax=Lentisphaera araneosa HTCC2155 TaxID=313628 RepID=A6DK56_9BACT|nr:transposase [Lentisphaera araneosa]EDM27754.1 hypothetical protein LNTAR_00095 [Lentisphaera araneosa HTCC2155]